MLDGLGSITSIALETILGEKKGWLYVVEHNVSLTDNELVETSKFCEAKIRFCV
jgi:hypothetical protein